MLKEHVTDEEDSSDSVCFLAKRNYKLSPSAGRNGAVSIQVNTVLGIGAELSLVHKTRIGPARHSHIHPVQSPRILEASKRMMKSCELMCLTVRIGDCRARVQFLVAQNLAVE